MSNNPEPHPVSRRTLLLTSGAALALGALGAEIGNLAVGGSPAPTETSRTTPPDVDLMEEHGVLKRVLLVYEECLRRISIGQPAPMSVINSGATVIHDFIESFHEALEEGYVFPALQKAGQLVDTVDTLYTQHARGRLLTQLILTESSHATTTATGADAMTNAMASFVRMYQPHEAREDTVVFPSFRAIHTPEQLLELGTTFAHLQELTFGPNGFADTIDTVAAIEKRLGIYDLNQFTPAAVNG